VRKPGRWEEFRKEGLRGGPHLFFGKWLFGWKKKTGMDQEYHSLPDQEKSLTITKEKPKIPCRGQERKDFHRRKAVLVG